MNDRDHSILWARDIVAHPDLFVILDTETTGLNWGDEIVQIALIDGNNQPLLNTMICPIHPIPPESTAIHHISDDMVQHSPTWPEVWQEVQTLLTGKTLISYNLQFDWKMIASSCAEHHDPPPQFNFNGSCAMLRYSAFFGEWSPYRQDWKWQPLPGGDHTALGDCRATFHLIQRMATAPLTNEQTTPPAHRITDEPSIPYGTS